LVADKTALHWLSKDDNGQYQRTASSVKKLIGEILVFTGEKMFMSLKKSEEPPKNLKTSHIPYLAKFCEFSSDFFKISYMRQSL
jgi:hypothetical protein